MTFIPRPATLLAILLTNLLHYRLLLDASTVALLPNALLLKVTALGHARPRVHTLPWHVAIGKQLATKANVTQGKYVMIRNLLVGS